jgi:hypothetical protein
MTDMQHGTYEAPTIADRAPINAPLVGGAISSSTPT